MTNINIITLEDYRDYCAFYNPAGSNSCKKCPLEKLTCAGEIRSCTIVDDTTDTDLAKIKTEILNWKKEYKCTRAEKFLQMYPNADQLENGAINICPMKVDYSLEKEEECLDTNCAVCKADYWTQLEKPIK